MYNFNFEHTGYISASPFNFNFGEELLGTYLYILNGNSDVFNSIWSDDYYLYVVADDNTMNVINLANYSVYDWYSKDKSGRSGDKLMNNAVVDINVV